MGAASQNPNPTFTKIDAPGAGTQIYEGTYPIKINTGGTIAGYLIDANLVAHSFALSQAGTFTVFEVPGADTSRQNGGTFAQSINASGTITGVWGAPSDNVAHGFYRTQDGTFTSFDVPVFGYGGVANLYINESGVITGTVGISSNANGFVRAADGTFSEFILPDSIGLNGTIPAGLNSNGVIIGYAYAGTPSMPSPRGFLRTPDGTLTEFDAPGNILPCACGTQPADINGSGAIVGLAYQASQQHSFLRSPDGAITVFDPPPAGAKGSFATLINDSGVIAGGYWDSAGTAHAYVRNLDGSFTTADAPILPKIETGATTIKGMNTSGAVVGVVFNTLGGVHGFLRQ